MKRPFFTAFAAAMITGVLAFSSPLMAQQDYTTNVFTVSALDQKDTPGFWVGNNSDRTVVVQAFVERVGLVQAVSRSYSKDSQESVTLMIGPYQEQAVELVNIDEVSSSAQYIVRLKQLPILYTAPGARALAREMDLSVLSVSFAFRATDNILYAEATGGRR